MESTETPKQKNSPWGKSPEINLDPTRFEWNSRCHKCHGKGFIGFDIVHKKIIPCKCLKVKQEKKMDVSSVKDAPNLIEIIKSIFGGKKKEENQKPEEKKV